MLEANFTRKKVGSLTLGEKLRKVRTDNRITLAEVSRVTKIQVKYLEALETGAYENLPPEVYARGFLRGYATYLGISEDTVIKLYERERSIQNNLTKTESVSRFLPSGPIRFHLPFSIRGIVIAVIAVIVFGFFSYLYLEFRSFVSEPRLVILSPMDGDTVTEAETVVRGETDPRAVIRINGVDTAVDEKGSFTESLSLNAGLNAITVSSTNRFGKTRERTVSVNAVLPEHDNEGSSVPAPENMATIRISVRATSATSVLVRADGETVWNGMIPTGEKKTFDAKEKVEISSTVGNAVMTQQNDETETVLSSGKGPASVIFGPNGRE